MKVLLLEDDPFLQMELEEIVQALGHDVLGPFSALPSAYDSCSAAFPDAAILDFNLGNGTDSGELADFLQKNDIPFAFTTGYTRKYINERFGDTPVIEKPYDQSNIARFLSSL